MDNEFFRRVGFGSGFVYRNSIDGGYDYLFRDFDVFIGRDVI